MKIVFDTNVLLSALLFPGFSTKVFDFCVVRYNLISSDWLLEELEEKLTAKFKLTDTQTETYISLLRERMAVVHPFNDLPKICRDIDDNHVLQVADYMTVDCIITGDKDLLDLVQYNQIQILTPRQFHDIYIENQ
jgi:uncharacterized protein